MNQIENAGTMWAKLGHTKKRKMPLSYLRGIFERCLAESNRCSRFCRPVPNRSAKAPFPVWDCKYRYFYLICKIYFILFYIQKESLEVFSFGMVDVYRVVARLVEAVQDADASAALGCRREDGEGEGLFVNYL